MIEGARNRYDLARGRHRLVTPLRSGNETRRRRRKVETREKATGLAMLGSATLVFAEIAADVRERSTRFQIGEKLGIHLRDAWPVGKAYRTHRDQECRDEKQFERNEKPSNHWRYSTC